MGQAEGERRIWRGQGTRTCEHTHSVTTFVAGLARSVCEACGKVSIRYLGDGAQWPEGHVGEGAPFVESQEKRDIVRQSGVPTCKRCGGEAYFITPWGLACTNHAWEAASRQDPLAGDFWIPLLIERSNAPD